MLSAHAHALLMLDIARNALIHIAYQAERIADNEVCSKGERRAWTAVAKIARAAMRKMETSK